MSQQYDLGSIVVISWCLIACYGLILVWTIVQAKLFLVDQQRYKNFTTLIFYMLAVSIILSRMIQSFN